jgi:hypothetical protein
MLGSEQWAMLQAELPRLQAAQRGGQAGVAPLVLGESGSAVRQATVEEFK